jgi:predicted nucleic acid-binding protein
VAVYYLDTSALVKRYAAETGTAWVVSLTNPTVGHEIATVRVSGPELIAALARKVRSGQLAPGEAERAGDAFRADWQAQYLIVELTAVVAERATDLAWRHGLRGYDALHLAAALELQNVRRSLGLPALTFISADRGQLQAASVEGLPVDDPNLHP